MNCFCKIKSYDLVLEAANFMAPICCNKCGCSLGTDEFDFSEELKTEIRVWTLNYEKLINNEVKTEQLYIFHKQHNAYGLELTKKIQKELDGKYTIEYFTS